MEQDTTPRSAARQAGLLFAAAGILTILNNYVPGSGYLDKAFLHVVGVVCIAIGAGVALLPWDRWPARATLAICPPFAIIAVANQRGGVSTYSHAPFFILVFMWVGLHHHRDHPGVRPGGGDDRPHGGPGAAAERDIQRSYSLLHRSQALANVGSWEWDVTTGEVEWSPEMFRILGFSAGEIDTAFEAVLNLVASEDRDMVATRFRQAAGGEAVPGLANRRAFVTVGAQLLRVAQRAGETALLIYIDLDNMKDVNDTYGHAAGDQALVEVADLLRSTFRESDLVARLGGDELAVFVPRQGAEAKAGLDRPRDAVDARQGRFPPVALSIGTSTYDGDGPCSIEDLIRRADAAMYAEKALRRLR